MRVPLGRDRRDRDRVPALRQAVHHHRPHPDRRWYPIEIEAAARSRFAEWESRLDAVLDAYFDDGDEAEDDESAEVDEAALAEAEAEVRKD